MRTVYAKRGFDASKRREQKSLDRIIDFAINSNLNWNYVLAEERIYGCHFHRTGVSRSKRSELRVEIDERSSGPFKVTFVHKWKRY